MPWHRAHAPETYSMTTAKWRVVRIISRARAMLIWPYPNLAIMHVSRRTMSICHCGHSRGMSLMATHCRRSISVASHTSPSAPFPIRFSKLYRDGSPSEWPKKRRNLSSGSIASLHVLCTFYAWRAGIERAFSLRTRSHCGLHKRQHFRKRMNTDKDYCNLCEMNRMPEATRYGRTCVCEKQVSPRVTSRHHTDSQHN